MQNDRRGIDVLDLVPCLTCPTHTTLGTSCGSTVALKLSVVQIAVAPGQSLFHAEVIPVYPQWRWKSWFDRQENDSTRDLHMPLVFDSFESSDLELHHTPKPSPGSVQLFQVLHGASILVWQLLRSFFFAVFCSWQSVVVRIVEFVFAVSLTLDDHLPTLEMSCSYNTLADAPGNVVGTHRVIYVVVDISRARTEKRYWHRPMDNPSTPNLTVVRAAVVRGTFLLAGAFGMQHVLFTFVSSSNAVTLRFSPAIADGSIKCRRRPPPRHGAQQEIWRVDTDFGCLPPTDDDRRRAIQAFKYENRQRQPRVHVP